MKKLLLAVVFLAGIFLFPSTATATGVVIDSDCVQAKIIDPNVNCNVECNRNVLNAGLSCPTGQPNANLSGAVPKPTNFQGVASRVQLFGFNFGPPELAIPALVRVALTIAFSAIALGSITYGVYGMIVRTTAADNAERVELSTKIFRNAIIGVLIAFGSGIIIQLAAVGLGLEDNLFEFNLIPSSRFTAITPNDLTQPCTVGIDGFIQQAVRLDIYSCLGGNWNQIASIGRDVNDPEQAYTLDNITLRLVCPDGQVGATRLGNAKTYYDCLGNTWVLR